MKLFSVNFADKLYGRLHYGVFTRSSKLPATVRWTFAGSLLDVCWIV